MGMIFLIHFVNYSRIVPILTTNLIFIIISDAPYFESNENTRLVISGRDEGDISATLHCVANGYPELNFDWINYPTGELF